jgi:hypothetical protein
MEDRSFTDRGEDISKLADIFCPLAGRFNNSNAFFKLKRLNVLHLFSHSLILPYLEKRGDVNKQNPVLSNQEYCILGLFEAPLPCLPAGRQRAGHAPVKEIVIP